MRSIRTEAESVVPEVEEVDPATSDLQESVGDKIINAEARATLCDDEEHVCEHMQDRQRGRERERERH